MRPDIVPGAVFSDYEVSDHHGTRRTLSELQRGDPLVVVLARGGLCPKDRRQHEGLPQLAHWTFLSDHRTDWEKGEKANFYPYGETQAQPLAEQD